MFHRRMLLINNLLCGRARAGKEPVSTGHGQAGDPLLLYSFTQIELRTERAEEKHG